ncbi:MAG: DUF1566 domain-containing protein [Vibrionaceae bacterium]|nr:DUF1566 domain-containing protein [Vibrionaceae bacterium]
MLFRQLVLSATIALAISGCSDQPPGSDPTKPNVDNGSGGNTTSDSDANPGTPTQPDSGSNVTPPTLPTNRSNLTISGPVVGSQETDTYAFQVCSGQVCEKWHSTMEEGGFAYKFQLSQWPLDQIVTVEGSKLTAVSANADSASNKTNVDDKSTSYFRTELDTLANILKMDSNDDGAVNETEVSTISLDPVTMAFNTVAKHLLQEELSHYSNLPYAERYAEVRHYLSENSKTSLIELNDEQKQSLGDHINTLRDESYNRRYYGSYTLQLTPKQWESVGGHPDVPKDTQVVTLNTAQMKTLHIRDNDREATNKQVTLSTAQTYSIQGKLVYNQQLVLELAALYALMSKQDPIKLTLSSWERQEVDEQIDALNPGSGEATIFEGTYRVSVNARIQQQLGVFDRADGKTSTLLFSADVMREVYKNSLEDKAANYVFIVGPMQWPTGDHSIPDVGARILSELSTQPSRSLLQHYEDQFGQVVGYQELENSLPVELQKHYHHQHQVNKLLHANHKHPLKPAILALAPERYLRISGRFPKELEQASLKVVLGSRLNPEKGGHFDNGRYPVRHQPLSLITDTDHRRNSLDLSGNNGFVTTIALRDTDNFYSRCRPGRPYEGKYKYEYTADEMQDTLTIHIRDHKTKVELRSVLGSFCELAKLDEQNGNNNGILEYKELERLNVGYVSTARAALLMKNSASKYGNINYLAPWKHEQLIETFQQMPRKQVEFLAAFIALQAKGRLFNSTISLIERGNLYDDLLALLKIDMSDKYGSITDNNTYPDVETLQERLSSTYPIGQVLLENLDINVSHITQNMLSLLSDSEVDDYYFPQGTRPGRWVNVYPNNLLDMTCQNVMQDDQLLGLRIEGKGKNSNGHWVTIGWDSQLGASGYTLGWDEQSFNQISEAQHNIPTNKQRTTISGLNLDSRYYIRVQSNIGAPSAVIEYSPRQIHVADSRITTGVDGDDSSRGRDSTSACDPLSGKAQNSNHDGILGARYIKLDNKGQPLVRQDLTYTQRAFTCVLDAQTGLIWETKHQRKEKDSYSIYDNDNMFVMKAKEGVDSFSATCTIPGLNIVSTNPAQCTVANQIKWVNNDKRCGLTNWRLPTLTEAYGLFDFGKSRANNIDNRFFPHLNFPRVDNDTFHGFWLDTQSLDQQQHRALSPIWLDAQYHSDHSYNPLVLVSDGFKIEQ